MDHKRIRRQKERMFNNDPHCMECGVLMWITPKNSIFRKGQLTQIEIDTMATIGHKYGKYDTRRYTELPQDKKHRLICHKCNQNEEKEESSKIPIEEKWRRSGRYKIVGDMELMNTFNNIN